MYLCIYVSAVRGCEAAPEARNLFYLSLSLFLSLSLSLAICPSLSPSSSLSLSPSLSIPLPLYPFTHKSINSRAVESPGLIAIT